MPARRPACVRFDCDAVRPFAVGGGGAGGGPLRRRPCSAVLAWTSGLRRRRRGRCAGGARLVPAGRRPRPARRAPAGIHPRLGPPLAWPRDHPDRRRPCSPASARRARIDGDRLDVTDAAALRGELMDELAFEAVFNADEALRDACRWVIWSASQALGCGIGQHPRAVPGPRARRVRRRPRSRCRPSTSVPPTYLTARQAFCGRPRARRGRGDLRDREVARWPTPTSGRRSTPRSSWPPRCAPAGRAPSSCRATTSSSTPRSGATIPDAEMAGLKDLTREAIGGRLPEHRHRQQHAGRPVAARRRRRSSAVNAANTVELTLLIRDHRAGRRDDQHRRRDRRGGEVELHRGGAARLPGRLLRAARTASGMPGRSAR